MLMLWAREDQTFPMLKLWAREDPSLPVLKLLAREESCALGKIKLFPF